MALTATAMRRDGWQDRARHFDFVPTLEADAELAELQHQISIKNIAAKMLNERIRKLVAESAAKDKRLAELEDGLRLSGEDLAHRDNESRSLQTSLDLVTKQYARLSEHLAEITVDAEALRTQLENSKTALLAAEVERDQLAVALRETKDLHRIESDELKNCLEAMASRTAATESLLVEVRKSLKACIEESDAAARKAADAALARDTADEALDQLHDSLQLKGRQVRELEQSRAMLIVGAGTLLEVFETRVAALGEAEERAKSFAGRVAEAEAKAALAHSQIESLNLKLQSREADLDEALETIQSLFKRAVTAESNTSAAQDEIRGLNLKLQSRQAGLDEAEDAIRLLATRVAAAEANASAAQDEIQGLNLKLQSRQAGLDEAEDAIRLLATRVAAAEANASAAQDEIQSLNLTLQNEQAIRAVAEAALRKALSDYSRLRPELGGLIEGEEAQPKQARQKQAQQKQAQQKHAQQKHAPARSATSLLAATISF
jgi:chromosome segregation ATPase